MMKQTITVSKENYSLMKQGLCILGVLFVVSLIILFIMKSGVLNPNMIECGKVIQRETQNVDLRGDTTRGIIQMTGGRKSFSLNGYAVDGDTVCKDGEGWIKKDAFISY